MKVGGIKIIFELKKDCKRNICSYNLLILIKNKLF